MLLSNVFGCLLQKPLIAQLVKNLPAMQQIPVQFLGREDPLEKGNVTPTPVFLGFPGGSDGRKATGNARDLGSILAFGKIPWRRTWQPTPGFLPMDRRAWKATVPGVAKSWTRLSD